MNIFALQNKGKNMKNILSSLLLIILFLGCSGNSDIKTLNSGLKYKDVVQSKSDSAATAKMGDLVELHFKAWVIKDSSDLFSDWSADTTKRNDLVADSYAFNQALKFVLGTDAFIKGSDEGIVGMKSGSQRVIIIPAGLAYGQNGMGPIPPNSSLRLLVELLSTKETVVAKMWDIDSTLIKTTPSGLKYVIIEAGEGDFIAKEKQVTVHYSGFLSNGTRFDSSIERDEPFTFVAGVGQVIPGWDEGIQLLKKGCKARLIIPPAIGYGDRDLGKIPPNSTLIFDVQVVDVK